MKQLSSVCLTVIAGLLVVLVSTRFSAAETVSTKSYSYFTIGGKTAEDLDRELSQRGPITKSTGFRHPGATEIKFGGELTYVEKGGKCAVGNVRVTLHTKILLPRWSNRRRTNADLALIWDTLSADIKRHEERHAEIARTYARDLDNRLRTLRPQADCTAMQKMVADVTQKVMDAHDKDQVRFDRVESKNFDARMTRLLKHRIEQRKTSR